MTHEIKLRSHPTLQIIELMTRCMLHNDKQGYHMKSLPKMDKSFCLSVANDYKNIGRSDYFTKNDMKRKKRKINVRKNDMNRKES